MKIRISYLLALIAMVGCAQQIEFKEPEETAQIDTAPKMRTRALQKAVYNESRQVWMIPQKDPYSLENFQKAYDRLANGKSMHKLTREQSAEFKSQRTLEATHYALRIYPHNEKEQRRVEMMNDVQISPIPFDYSILTPEELELSYKTLVKSADNTFSDESPYTITYKGYVTAEGISVKPKTIKLPILYAVWPISKPLPTDIEYVVDYYVFLPITAAKTQKTEMLNILENEALSAAWGTQIKRNPTRKASTIVSGIATNYDNYLGRNVPMANLRVVCLGGSNIGSCSTDNYGKFKVETPDIPASIYFQFKDEYGRWIIVFKDYSYPIGCYTYKCTNGWTEGITNLGEVILDAGSSNEIHRALNVYFNDQTNFPKFIHPGGITVEAYTADESEDLSWNGLFSSNSEGECRISIANLGYYNPDSHVEGGDVQHENVIGTTLHELGHFMHFKELGFYGLKYTNLLLKESFSSYSGWYLGREYYESLGWSNDDIQLLSSQARQYWSEQDTTSIGRFYSPLFVDLTDSYNQGSDWWGVPYDEISGLHPYYIWKMISTCSEWNSGPLEEQFRHKIGDYVGENTWGFDSWISEFDKWFAKPENDVYSINQLQK